MSWTCTPQAGASCGAASGSGNISTTVSLPSGKSATFSASGTVASSATGSISNTATTTAPAGVTDSPTSNNSATDTDTITLSSDLRVTKTGPSSVYYLNSITYTIVVTNNGPSDVTGAQVTDNLPAGLTGASWTCTASAGSTCPASGSGNISTTVTLVSGGTATFTLSATVSSATLSSITNTATASVPAGVTDSYPNNNSSSVTTSVNKRLVQLVYTGASSGQYSDPVGASATLMDVTNGSPGTPISGRTITFSLGGQTFTAVTNAAGLAQTTTAVADRLNQPSALAAKTMATSFGPDAVYASATDSDSYTVNKEDEVVSMIEPSIIQTDGTDGDVDSLTLTLTIDESTDGFLSGALPNAPSGQTGLKNAYPIPTTLVPVSNGNTFGSCTPALTSYATVDADTSTAYCNIANVPMDTYEINAVIGGDYFLGQGDGAIVVFDPALGFITGGGWYTTAEGRLNFGFNAKYLKSGQVQGSLLVNPPPARGQLHAQEQLDGHSHGDEGRLGQLLDRGSQG